MIRRSPMKRGKRINPKRKTPRRTRPELFFRPRRDERFLDPDSYVTKGGRFRLAGVDYERLRWSAYMRANGEYSHPAFCECGCGRIATWKKQFDGDPDAGDFAHNEHGARKSDELDRGKWMRHECHMKSHNCGGKPIAVRKRDIKMEVA